MWVGSLVGYARKSINDLLYLQCAPKMTSPLHGEDRRFKSASTHHVLSGEQMLSLEQGIFLVKQARKAMVCQINKKTAPEFPNDDWLSLKRGAFVTLHTFPEKELRGCIGFSAPCFSIKDAIARAAVAAAVEDPRFAPLKEPELDKIIVEISVLTLPQKIEASNEKEILESITPKVDGLILERNNPSGLFLPQVWDELPEKREFLEHLCYKAGLSDVNAWHKEGTTLYKFSVQAFEEKTPGGVVAAKDVSA